MFKRRNSREEIRQLKQQIRWLEDQLAHYKEKSVFMENEKLPKCESMVCEGCFYAVFREGAIGGLHLIGCGKNVKCESYTPISFDREERHIATRLEMQGR